MRPPNPRLFAYAPAATKQDAAWPIDLADAVWSLLDAVFAFEPDPRHDRHPLQHPDDPRDIRLGYLLEVAPVSADDGTSLRFRLFRVPDEQNPALVFRAARQGERWTIERFETVADDLAVATTNDSVMRLEDILSATRRRLQDAGVLTVGALIAALGRQQSDLGRLAPAQREQIATSLARRGFPLDGRSRQPQPRAPHTD